MASTRDWFESVAEAERRRQVGLPTPLEEQQMAEIEQVRAEREERVRKWGLEQMAEGIS